ncbi:MAG: hypothetical protein ACI84K_002096 [Pseudohongiellaceae bacterium]|jgi:hypothetical protein
MQKEKEQHIECLEQLTGEALPAFFNHLSASDTEQIYRWVSSVIVKERASLDKLFDAMTHTFKYIPNFLLIAITNKYIEAPIAARITEKLSLKQAVAIAGGLSADYVGETALYLDSQFAAKLLLALPKKQAKQIVVSLVHKHPLTVLDVFTYADKKLFNVVKPLAGFEQIDCSVLSDSRKGVLARIQ